jgi:flagellar assembly protein FliH
MTSSPKKGIIRGATVLGSVFLGKAGVVSKSQEVGQAEEEQKNLKALEEFWLQKGMRAGEEAGYKKGWKEGDTKGYIRGLEEGKKQGLEEGKKQGFEEGKSSVEEKEEGDVEQRLLILQNLIEEFKIKSHSLHEQIKPELIELSLQVCQKVIHNELKDPNDLARVTGVVLDKGKKLIDGMSADVFFSEKDFVALGPLFEKIKKRNPEAKDLNFYSDDSLNKGSVKLETNLGIINFDINRQIEDLRENLLR